jgi:hypothetical protein
MHARRFRNDPLLAICSAVKRSCWHHAVPQSFRRNRHLSGSPGRLIKLTWPAASKPSSFLKSRAPPVRRRIFLTRDQSMKSSNFRAKPARTRGARLLKIVYRPVEALKPDPANPRRHSKNQIRQIADSIQAFDFNVPILTGCGKNHVAERFVGL